MPFSFPTSSGEHPSVFDAVLQEPVAWLALLISIIVVGFTIWRAWRDHQLQNSHDYLAAAIRLLERAHETFAANLSAEWNGLPEPDRLLWLTAARMLRESESTAQNVKVRSHKVLYQHARNFWRGKLYDILRSLGDAPLTYFAEDADSILVTGGDQRMCLSDKSLRVVLDFLRWPKDRPDPLEGIESYSDSEIDRIRSFEYWSVADFLEAKEAMLKGDEARKEAWRQKFRDAAKSQSTK